MRAGRKNLLGGLRSENLPGRTWGLVGKTWLDSHSPQTVRSCSCGMEHWWSQLENGLTINAINQAKPRACHRMWWMPSPVALTQGL